jgi:hypothetical protein
VVKKHSIQFEDSHLGLSFIDTMTQSHRINKTKTILFQVFSQKAKHVIVEIHAVFFALVAVAFVVFYQIGHIEAFVHFLNAKIIKIKHFNIYLENKFIFCHNLKAYGMACNARACVMGL